MATATFEVRKFRDIEVVVNTADEKRPINLTKLAASLTGSRTSFRDMVKKNSGFWKIVASYTASKTSKDSVEAFASTENNDLQKLFDKGVLVLVNGGSDKQTFGTYGPTWLADWIVINFKPEFFKQIHELFEVLETAASLKGTTFNEEVESILAEKDYEIQSLRGKVASLKDENDDLRNQYAAIMEQLRQIQETATDTQTELHIVSNSLDVVHNDLHDVMTSSEILARELGNQTAANHSTATITFNLLFFTSPEIPRSETKRNKANLNQSWIGCSCCEQRNSERILPRGSRIVYQRVVNSRDTCEFVFRQMKDYFIETNYKHFLIQNNQINDFFNDLDELLNDQSEHESVRNFEAIETAVQERRVAEERERFINELKARKETREN